MKSRILLACTAIVAVLIVASPADRAAAKDRLYFNFEKSLNPFSGTFDPSASPAAGMALERVMGDNGCADNGKAYANLKATADVMGKVLWMGARISAEGNQQVDLTLSARDTGNCATCVPVGYVGADAPRDYRSFEPLTLSPNDPPNVGEWNTYRFQGAAKAKDALFVAVGWRAQNDTMSPLTNLAQHGSLLKSQPDRRVLTGAYGFDCIALSIYPAP